MRKRSGQRFRAGAPAARSVRWRLVALLYFRAQHDCERHTRESRLSATAGALGSRFRVGEWSVEPELNQISRSAPAAVQKRLEPKVMDLLVYLAARPNRTVSRRELLDGIWGERFVVEGVLTRCVFELRQLLDDDTQTPRYIQTVPKKGYRLIAAVAAELLAAASGTAPAASEVPQRAVAVLPFRDLNPDLAEPLAERRNAHLEVGLADATIGELALIRGLIVRPTSTVLRYRQSAVDPQQAGRELAVDAVLVGTFQRAGARLRVTVQLIATEDGRALWAAKINTSLDDLFEMQDQVSRNIARALEIELAPPAERRRRPRGPAGEVYELVLKGRIHLLHESLEECLAAMDCFDQACAADPGSALGWAGLADAYSRIAFTFLPEGDWYARAWAACEQALALEPELPEALYVRGGRLRWSPHGGFDHAGALRDLVPALAARPSLEDGHVRLAVILHHVGLIDEVERELDRALSFSPDHFMARQHHGLCLVTRGRFREARAIYRAAVAQAPESWLHYRVALCELQLGELDEAAATLEQLVRQTPRDVLQYPIRGLLAALRDDPAQARQQALLTVEHRRSFGHYHHAQYDIACIYALLGDHGAAVTWLDEAARNGFPCYPQFAGDPFLRPLQGERRFTALLEKLRQESAGYGRLYGELRALHHDGA